MWDEWIDGEMIRGKRTSRMFLGKWLDRRKTSFLRCALNRSRIRLHQKSFKRNKLWQKLASSSFFWMQLSFNLQITTPSNELTLCLSYSRETKNPFKGITHTQDELPLLILSSRDTFTYGVYLSAWNIQ